MDFNKMGSGLKYIKEIISQGRNKDKPWNLKNQQTKLNSTKNPHNTRSRHGNK